MGSDTSAEGAFTQQKSALQSEFSKLFPHYDFDASVKAGELVSNINFWNGEHTWTGWDGTEYRNEDTHYNFHDADWNNLASAGSFERYIVVEDGDDVLDETGSHSGYSVSTPDDVAAIVERHFVLWCGGEKW